MARERHSVSRNPSQRPVPHSLGLSPLTLRGRESWLPPKCTLAISHSSHTQSGRGARPHVPPGGHGTQFFPLEGGSESQAACGGQGPSGRVGACPTPSPLCTAAVSLPRQTRESRVKTGVRPSPRMCGQSHLRTQTVRQEATVSKLVCNCNLMF